MFYSNSVNQPHNLSFLKLQILPYQKLATLTK
nr:MAG TPA: hypothetical protein [Caudoviricetes sp.]